MIPITIGFINRVLSNNIVEVQTGAQNVQAQIIFDYGYSSKIPLSSNTQVLIYKIDNSSQNLLCKPFNLTTQSSLKTSEVQLENSATNSKVLLAQDGSIQIETTNSNITIDSSGNIIINSTNNVNMTGTIINLGDATANALNLNADLSVTIPSGSSAGTYPIDINNAGQTKVKV